MPAYTNSTAVARNEIAGVIRQGTGMNAMNIWRDVLPVYPVNRRTSHLLKKNVSTSDIARILTDKYITLPGAEVEEITVTYGDDTFSVVIRKRKVKIPDENQMDLSGYLSIEQDAAQTGEENLELTHEYLVANAIFNTTNFGSATNSVNAYTVANKAIATPVADLYAAIERARDKGEQPNTFIIPSLVMQRLRQFDDLRGFLQGMGGYSPVPGQEVTPTLIQKAFADEGIEKVLIGRSRYNTAAYGATPSYTKIWPNTYIWVGRTGGAFLKDQDGISTVQGAGASIFWQDYTPKDGFGVDTYRHEDTESNYVRTKTSLAPYIANGNAGTLIATQYA